MGLGILTGERSFVRADYLYPATTDPAATLFAFRDAIERRGIGFLFFKGNDTLLHYTLVDWSSGARKMVDLYEASRALWHGGRRTEEWLSATFHCDFELSRLHGGTPMACESERLEMDEVNLRLVYNGRAFLGAETWSLVTTCLATGILTGTSDDAGRANAGVLVGGLLAAWDATAPLFGTVTVGERPVVEVPTVLGPARLPRQAWMVMVSPKSGLSCSREAIGDRGKMVARSMPDGSTLIENLGRRPAEVAW